MSSFHLERLSLHHLTAAAELEAKCFSQPWSASALEILTRDGGFGIAAMDRNGKLIGYGGMLTVLDEGQITNVAVSPDFRRQGVGKAIMRALTEEAKQRGISLISLEVRVSNLAAQKLYLGLGFTEAGIRKRFYAHPVEDASVMLLNLNSSNP